MSMHLCVKMQQEMGVVKRGFLQKKHSTCLFNHYFIYHYIVTFLLPFISIFNIDKK